MKLKYLLKRVKVMSSLGVWTTTTYLNLMFDMKMNCSEAHIIIGPNPDRWRDSWLSISR